MLKLNPQVRRYGPMALALLLTVAVAVAAKLYFFPSAKKSEFVTATAALSDLEQSVLATGTLQAFKQVSVGAQASGQVRSLKVALGDAVKKGQLVAEIDSMKQQNDLRNTQAALDSARAQLASKQAALKQAELAFRRQQELLALDAISRESFEQADAKLETTRAEIRATEAQIAQAKIAADTAQVNLGYTKILAPMDGVVVAIVTQEGQTVNANQSAPTIIKLALLDTITVKAQISEADVVRVRTGQKAYFTILGAPEKRYYTTLRTMEPAPDSIAKEDTSSSSSSASAIYYNGLLDVPNTDGRLRISMTAQVYIVLNEAKQVLTIPAAALGERGRKGMTTVRVLGEDGKALERQVKVGINNNVNAQILEGLAVGDKVVTGEAPAAGSQPQTGRQMPRMRF
ncbi:efflux RND transporter periplasmic adaptor subunit [Polaromonas sp.]|uniref:efflux RND transporter periplasmic adaptor subunit n=1 Tax=Polaromonas sp. TaxID=1869339 RepID=UPI002FC58129